MDTIASTCGLLWCVHFPLVSWLLIQVQQNGGVGFVCKRGEIWDVGGSVQTRGNRGAAAWADSFWKYLPGNMRGAWYPLLFIEKSTKGRIWLLHSVHWGGRRFRPPGSSTCEPRLALRSVGMGERVYTRSCRVLLVCARPPLGVVGVVMAAGGAGVAGRICGAIVVAAPCTVSGVPLLGPPHPRCCRSCNQSSTGCSCSAVVTCATSVAVLDMASSTTGTSPLSSMLPSAHVLAMRWTRWARGQQAAARLQETLSKFFLALGVLLFLLACKLGSACAWWRRRVYMSTSAFSFWSLVLFGACPTLRGTSCAA